MTREDKDLLFKDLCARLPYKVKCYCEWKEPAPNGTSGMIDGLSTFLLEEFESMDEYEDVPIKSVQPYLRPMSSMTTEENGELKYVIELGLQALEGEEGHNTVSAAPAAFEVDFYNKHHFDYRGLIEKGLAIEAPENMYKID